MKLQFLVHAQTRLPGWLRQLAEHTFSEKRRKASIVSGKMPSVTLEALSG